MLPHAIAFLALCSASDQGVGSLDVSNQVAARLVEFINHGDAQGVRSLAGPDFFKVVPAERLAGLVERVHSFGVFSSPKLIVDLGEQRQYRLTMSHEGRPDQPILLTLGVERDQKFFAMEMGPYKEPIPRTKPLLTDNRQASAWDKSVQAAVDRFAGQNNVAGMSIGIAWKGRQSFYNYGEAKTGTGVLPTSRTIYEIGSITKTMTGFLIAQAILDRKLDLDADIRKYLPGTYPNLEFDGKPILLRHLVTHTSGLPANPPGIPDDGKADAYERFSHAALLSDLASIKLTKAPGAAFSYSNMGAGLCGPILERAYGASFEALLQRAIFRPAGMKHSGISLSPEMDRSYATPYDSKGVQTDRWVVNGIESAGAVRSNAEDMLRYARFNLNERNRAVALSHRLQSPAGLKPFGIFWVKADSRLGGAYIDHEGGTGGFTSHILVMPEKKLAVVVLTNSGEVPVGPLAYEIALRLLNGR